MRNTVFIEGTGFTKGTNVGEALPASSIVTSSVTCAASLHAVDPWERFIWVALALKGYSDGLWYTLNVETENNWPFSDYHISNIPQIRFRYHLLCRCCTNIHPTRKTLNCTRYSATFNMKLCESQPIGSTIPYHTM